MQTSGEGISKFLSRSYASTSTTEALALYNEWAAHYDQQLDEAEYMFPSIAVDAYTTALGSQKTATELTILDAGCGTGLVGLALQKAGLHVTVDGVDLSPGMLEVAGRSGAYRALDVVDLTKPIPRDDSQYDAVFCVGTLTKGHVGPVPVMDEFVRVVRKDGSVVATVLEAIWESDGFKAKVDQLEEAGIVTVLRSETVGITKGATGNGRILVLKKL